MRLTRLEIFGFKSFVERFVLNFDKNIIGIVGPNGCGKSNIVDSLRWVLGETHAKQLRGSSLEDLIFNGSDSRRPLGMAEVTITIRPDEGWLSFDPHLRNREPANTADELPQTITAITAEMDETVAPQTTEVEADAESAVLELSEADGSQIAEVLLPEVLEATESQFQPPALSEIPGLFDAAEIQLTRRLYRSGESEYFINRVPCRLRDMIDIYRLIGLGSRGLSIVQQGQIGQLISKKPVERRELLEEAAGISGFRARMEVAQRQLEKTQENMARVKDIIAEVEKQTRILKRQAARARARNELKEQLTKADLGLYLARSARIVQRREKGAARRETLKHQLAESEAALRGVQAEEEARRAHVTTFDTELVALRRRRDELYRQLNAERERLQEQRVELARLESRLKASEDEERRDASRVEQIERELTERKERISSLTDERMAAESRKTTAEQALLEVQERARVDEHQASQDVQDGTTVENEFAEEIRLLNAEVEKVGEVSDALKQAERSLGDSRRAESEADKSLQKLQLQLTSLESEERSLERQIEAVAEHAAQGFTGEAAEKGKELLERLRADGLLKTVFAAGITVPAEYQQAVAAALGERGNYVVSANPEALAKRFKESSTAQVGVLSESPLSAQERIQIDSALLAAFPEVRTLLDCIECTAEVRTVAERLFTGIIVVPTLETAFALQRQLVQQALVTDLQFVTTKGEVVTSWGWYTTQSKGLGLSFTRRIEEIREQATHVRNDVAAAEEGLGVLAEAVRSSREKIQEFSQEKDRLIACQRRLASLLQLEKEAERKARQAAMEQQRLRREAFLKEERAAQGVVRQRIEELARASSSIEGEERRLQSLRDERQSLLQRKEANEQVRMALLGDVQAVQQLLEQQTTGEAEARVSSISTDFEKLESEIRRVEDARAMIAEELASLSQDAAEHRRAFDALNKEEQSSILELERLELEAGMLLEDIQRYYSDPSVLPTNVEVSETAQREAELLQQDIQALQEEAQKLRSRLEREGEVDPQSIELYDQEQARLESMISQLADLEEARSILERTIRQLREISRRRFLETYQDVSSRFAELIPRLFGGGAGHMELINPDDPLASGVELHVRPPGKKLSNMELMSGGEKALVATAVLLAMFLHRPSPICVLDEVDAPLDEANLERYIGLIKEISERTQFLVITHNKTTMGAVDRLVGITMQESGVSTALSVTLEDAERELERWAANA